MNLTTIHPSVALLGSAGHVLGGLGAEQVVAADPTTIKATFTSNERAVNVEALLKDSVDGVALLVDNQSLTTDAPVASVDGILKALEGVEGLSVSAARAKCPGGPTFITITPKDPYENTAYVAEQLFEEQPIDGVQIRFVIPEIEPMPV